MKRNQFIKFLSLFLFLIFILVMTGCAPKTADTLETTETTAAAASTTKEETTAVTTTAAPDDTAVLDPALTGKWVEENSAMVEGLPYLSIECLEDGACIIADPATKGKTFIEGTYKIVDGKLQCTFGADVFLGEYEIAGTKLTISKDNGESKVYIKGDTAELDPELLGKWIGKNNTVVIGLPYLSIEFLDDGTCILFVPPSYAHEGGYQEGTYQVADGKLQCSFEGTFYTTDYELDGTELTLSKDNGEAKIYILYETTELDPLLIGKWVEQNSTVVLGLPFKSIELFEDGTGTIAGIYPAQYKMVDGKLQCTVENEVYISEYKIDGTKLTISKDNGESKVYIKQDTTELDPLLIGKWVEENSTVVLGLPYKSIELFADGTATIGGMYPAAYKIVDGKLQCTVEDDVFLGEYEIDGTKLTIFKDNGEFKVYLKEE